MSVFIWQNFSHLPKVFLSGSLCGELPKNLVICFKGTLAPLLTTKTPQGCLLLLNFKQQISPYLLKLLITENHLKSPKTIYKHPKQSTIIQNQSPKNICNNPKPTNINRNHPQSARIYLELAVTGVKPSIFMWQHPQSFTKYFRQTLVFMWNSTLRQTFNFCFSRNFC